MILPEYFEAAAGMLGCLLLLVAVWSRPFGKASWHFAAFASLMALAASLLAFLGSSASATSDAACLWAFRALLVAAVAALGFALFLDGSRSSRRSILYFSLLAAALGLGYWIRPLSLDDEAALPAEAVLVGLPGHAAALFLLCVSVAVLVRLEQTFRRAEEHVRWEIKFVVLGTYACLATLIYLASRMLLRSQVWCYLPKDTLRVIPIVFGVSCLLMLAFWRRLSHRSSIAISQQAAYGSLTFLGVGIYLIGISLAARWVSTRMQGGVELSVVIFILSSLFLTLVLCSTRVRHRVRYWMRRHFFAGSYDYRRYWLEAVERVRSHEPPAVLAGALADIVLEAVGALDVSVWLRTGTPGVLHRFALRGNSGAQLPLEVPMAVARLQMLKEPFLVADLSPEDASILGQDGLKQANAAVVVPLRSGDETVGLVTVGHDKSGRKYDREALEILRALGAHMASEFHKTELLAAQVEAKEAETFQSFATFVLHDLKNFASTLSLIAKNAVRHQANPDFQRDAFESVLETAEKMKRICNSLGAFTGALAKQRAPQQLNDVVREAVKNFQGPLGERLRLDLGAVSSVDIDGDEIARVVQNLVMNATEAITSQGIVQVSTREHSGHVELLVQDDGQGISQEFLERELFLPFKTTKSAGLGIGLYQSRKIIDAHGGTIRVESKQGLGTMVVVTLPPIAARESNKG